MLFGMVKILLLPNFNLRIDDQQLIDFQTGIPEIHTLLSAREDGEPTRTMTHTARHVSGFLRTSSSSGDVPEVTHARWCAVRHVPSREMRCDPSGRRTARSGLNRG
ncbi:hypothetical protein ACKI2N_030700 [Cupriavidus sp. 30B13]|uniref:hypothetical protein n=1 Tax=Cupriavidus sp. 30B13 TaxID=3384241 RepID=UPI003B8F034C